MNERIKELAKQLGYNVNFKPSTDEVDRSYQVVSNDFAEKFAELIVRECADVLLEWKKEPFPLDPDFAANLIKEHFGVEK